MKSSYGPAPITRSLALTIPAVTVDAKPNGFPTATTQSPTSNVSESPSFAVGSGFFGRIFKQRDIGFLIDSNDFRFVFLSRGQTYANLLRQCHNVGVGHDESIAGNNESRAKALLSLGAVRQTGSEELPKKSPLPDPR